VGGGAGEGQKTSSEWRGGVVDAGGWSGVASGGVWGRRRSRAGRRPGAEAALEHRWLRAAGGQSSGRVNTSCSARGGGGGDQLPTQPAPPPVADPPHCCGSTPKRRSRLRRQRQRPLRATQVTQGGARLEDPPEPASSAICGDRRSRGQSQSTSNPTRRRLNLSIRQRAANERAAVPEIQGPLRPTIGCSMGHITWQDNQLEGV